MNVDDRRIAICQRMAAERLDCVVGIHDGTHFIETHNPVMVLSSFKSLGPAAAVLDRVGALTLIVTPAWDAERARGGCPTARVVGADDIVEALGRELGSIAGRAKMAISGLAAVSWAVASRIASAFPGVPSADAILFDATMTKTGDEIAYAGRATRIAEHAYQRMLEIVRPGLSEDELAAELCWYTRTLGAEDNFLLLCSGPHNRAVQPSNGRRMQAGDIVLAEITPSFRGQLAQICRTVVLGHAGDALRRNYDLVIEAMNAGIQAAVPGTPMSTVCRTINSVFEARGYGKYCHPPHIRRRGHGLGFASNQPGDVSLDNNTILAPNMLFMIHPNQYLPETGYLLCGEPIVITESGADALTAKQAALAQIAV